MAQAFRVFFKGICYVALVVFLMIMYAAYGQTPTTQTPGFVVIDEPPLSSGIVDEIDRHLFKAADGDMSVFYGLYQSWMIGVEECKTATQDARLEELRAQHAEVDKALTELEIAMEGKTFRKKEMREAGVLRSLKIELAAAIMQLPWDMEEQCTRQWLAQQTDYPSLVEAAQ